MALPKSWHDINVAQMIEISQTETYSVKNVQNLLDLFVNSDELGLEEFMGATIELINILQTTPEIVPCEEFTFNGSVYKMKHVDELTVNEYVDFEEFNDKPIENLPNLLAIIYTSDKDTGEYISDIKNKAREFLDLPADIANSALLFFSKNFLLYTQIFLESLVEENPKMANQIKEIQENLKLNLVGMTSFLESQAGTLQTDEQSKDLI